MITTPHLLTGALIGVTLKDPIIAIPIALGSHVILDMVPHYDFPDHKKADTKKVFLYHSLDILLGISLIYYFLHDTGNLPYIFLIVFIADLPDIFTKLRFVFKNNFFKKFQELHESIQPKVNSKLINISLQLVYTAVLVYYFKIL